MAVTEVVVGRGLLGEVLVHRTERRRVAVVTDVGARPVATEVLTGLREAGLEASEIEVPQGEAAKTLAVAETVYASLNALGLTRHDTLVAVGGGAVTDLGGFVAATYLRGVEAVYCPTTLLGAVDAAIGGKTGVNVGGKNLVGAFAHPARVLIDIDVLDRLPDDLLRQGMAEALKAGLVGDVALVELLEAEGAAADLEAIVGRAVAVKTAVVAEDFKEEGRRAILNYGHTVGHAVEVAGSLTHGEAVALGMIVAGRVSSAQAGFQEEERVAAIIADLGLPTRLDADISHEELLDLVRLDKKRGADQLRMVLLHRIGEPTIEPVDEDSVLEALSAISPA